MKSMGSGVKRQGLCEMDAIAVSGPHGLLF